MAEKWQETLAEELQSWLEPVVATEGHPESVEALLEAMGWRLNALPGSNQQSLAATIGDLAAHGRALFDTLQDPPESLEDFLLEVAPEVGAAVAAIAQLANALPAGLPANVDELPADALNYLTVQWLLRRHRIAYFLLGFLGAIRSTPPTQQEFNGLVLRIPSDNPMFSSESLLKLLEKPEEVLKSAFWPTGTSDSDGA